MYTTLDIELIDQIEEKDESFFCVMCGFPHRSRDDFEKQKEWGCCNECFLSFVESRRKEWKDGWRPDKETLEEYIYNRKRVLLYQEKK